MFVRRSGLNLQDVPSVAMNNILSGYWSNAFSDFGALRANGTITNTSSAHTLADDYWQRRARQAYWAAVSFTDDMVGRIVAAAKAHSLWDEAAVVLYGDHGYQLGENDQWSKVSNFEQAVRIPLIARAPLSVAPPGLRGARTSALWEAVDLLPTVNTYMLFSVLPGIPIAMTVAKHQFPWGSRQSKRLPSVKCLPDHLSLSSGRRRRKYKKVSAFVPRTRFCLRHS